MSGARALLIVDGGVPRFVAAGQTHQGVKLLSLQGEPAALRARFAQGYVAVQLAAAFGHLAAVKTTRQADIAEQQVRSLAALQMGKGSRTVLERLNLITQLFQHFAHHQTQGCLVLDQQNACSRVGFFG